MRSTDDGQLSLPQDVVRDFDLGGRLTVRRRSYAFIFLFCRMVYFCFIIMNLWNEYSNGVVQIADRSGTVMER